MANVAVVRARFPRTVAGVDRYAGSPARGLDAFGRMVWFTLASVGAIPLTLRRYRAETVRLIAQIGMGSGALAVVGGTVAIVAFVTLTGSSLVAIQGFSSLGDIGVEVFTGLFVS